MSAGVAGCADPGVLAPSGVPQSAAPDCAGTPPPHPGQNTSTFNLREESDAHYGVMCVCAKPAEPKCIAMIKTMYNFTMHDVVGRNSYNVSIS